MTTRFTTAVLAGIFLLNLAVDAQAARIGVQIDFNTAAGSYSGTQSPGHATGFFRMGQTTWNAANGDLSNLSYYSDNALITGATGINLDLGQGRVDAITRANTLNEATGEVGWEYGAAAFAASASGFYDTSLMRDILYSSNVQIGARVRGLPAGSYRVYSIDAFTGDLSRTYQVSVGVNIQRPGDAISTVNVGPGTGASSWLPGPGNPSNYVYTDVTISGPSDWITIIVRGPVSPAMNGIQISTLPEPAMASVLVLSGLILWRRR